ncbi:methylated-DNA--[protein]-cysteine S-methyltransferase [Paenibacillus sp. N3.4]|uniref:methylated-DNA--[protein]-cysteine S-methyltransferase n=1 Tax=Paenibacillus sp. N3.4 TaxID=2603222 RepID=UPI0011C9E380|nr:methylated-DNA--[protein]-cysteine S-methyltransferase [Paenibacillus sp. N3.4]TXK82688.1 methylated-DNA--[protein]-cysteine S-methyltransferase [Paenibacillus sp. N3.4]
MTQNQTKAAPILSYTEITSPIGPLVLVASTQGLCSIAFGTFAQTQHKLRLWALRWYGEHELQEQAKQLETISLQLEQYFKKERLRFEGEMDLQGTEFQKRVWTALLSVPYGETVSYKHIAEAIGSPKAVRAVGGANNKNPIPVIIPCHRIIGANGDMVGYGGGLDIKERLLDLERLTLGT